MKVDPKLLDQIGELEVDALLEGLNDPEMRTKPAFLARVRQFLKENNLEVSAETPGVKELMKKQTTTEIPKFGDNIIAMDR